MTESRAFPGTLAAASEAEAWASAVCARAALSREAAFAVTLCLEELFVNAVRHGRARQIRVALNEAALEFRDDGAAFDSTRPRPERSREAVEIGGFGVGLVHRFAESLAYRRADGWNVVTLAFAPAAR